MLNGYDSSNYEDTPMDGDFYLAYDQGKYEQVAEMTARHPGKIIITTSIFTNGNGMMLDVEPSCVWPPEGNAPDWINRQRADGENPSLYVGGRANWARVIRAIDAAGIAHPPYHVAHYTNVAHLCDTNCFQGSDSDVGNHVAVATQWGGDLDGHFDRSIAADVWPGIYDRSTPIADEDDMTPEQAAQQAEIYRMIASLINPDFVVAHPMAPGEMSIGSQVTQRLGLEPSQIQDTFNRVQVIQEDVEKISNGNGTFIELSDSDIAKISKAVADEYARRLSA